MAFIHSPKISTDGLVLYLDAANKKSYPGNGTVWNDLSGNNNNGTLTNGPTFDSDGRGSIVFDGTDDSVDLSDNTYTRFPHDSAWSICITYMPDTQNTTYPGILIKGDSTAAGVLIFYTASGFFWKHNNTQTIFTNRDLGIIKQICLTYSGSGNVYAYINGILSTTVGTMTSTENSSQLKLGRGDEYGDVKIYQFLKYNRALSAQEVLQNFNVTRSRFGI